MFPPYAFLFPQLISETTIGARAIKESKARARLMSKQ